MRSPAGSMSAVMGRFGITFQALFMLLLLFGIFSTVVAAPFPPENEEDVNYWNTMGQADLKAALDLELNRNVARNVILFLGDGMGVSTLTAARILKGQLQNRSGEEEQLTFDKFPHTSLVKVYTTNAQGPDSAGTATAFLSGVKTRSGVIGLGPSVPRSNCTAQAGAELSTILDWSENEGKSVGIVTTTRITHATPAAAYAHAANRDWEGDSRMSSVTGDCKDIALQLVEDNSNIRVLLGGGRRWFIPNDQPDPGTGAIDATNGRRDSRDLIQEWKDDKETRNKTHSFVLNKEQLDAVDPENTDYLLGLFTTSHMEYEVLRPPGPTGEPSIVDMTEKAIQILQKNHKGFFLLVEGGRIDHGHHGTRAHRALQETIAFDKAIEKAVQMTDQKETLIVVTADHSHVFTVGGYPSRGNPIFGVDNNVRGSDSMPMTTLLYANGPGYKTPREDITDIDTEAHTYRQQTAVPLSSETHGSEDVTAHAIGPMSHLFHGVKEQNYIAHAMAYASCVGQNKGHCERQKSKANGFGATPAIVVFGIGVYFLTRITGFCL